MRIKYKHIYYTLRVSLDCGLISRKLDGFRKKKQAAADSHWIEGLPFSSDMADFLERSKGPGIDDLDMFEI